MTRPEGNSPHDRNPGRKAAFLAACALLAALASCASRDNVRKGEETAIEAPARELPGAAPAAPAPPPPAAGTEAPPPALPSEREAPVLALPPTDKVPPIPSAKEEKTDPDAVLRLEQPEEIAAEKSPRAEAAPPEAVVTARRTERKETAPAEPGKGGKAVPRATAPGKGTGKERGAAEHAAAPVRPWEKEELSFQVRYLGVPCGYARFRTFGRVSLGGREAIHLQVRGWTSKLLSIVYPLDTTMEYYIDPTTLLPIRIDQTKTERGKYRASIAIYDQAAGVITYWEKATGRMEKKIKAIPAVHDPVTVVYNIRTLDPATAQTPRYVYAGRKIWLVQPRRLGFETVKDENGRDVETVVLAPEIRREGQVENKGEFRVWISRDARHAPLLIHASIKLGTLEGRLIPAATNGGT
jgi:hypothetical protein